LILSCAAAIKLEDHLVVSSNIFNVRCRLTQHPFKYIDSGYFSTIASAPSFSFDTHTNGTPV
jgi:hypothetical protein